MQTEYYYLASLDGDDKMRHYDKHEARSSNAFAALKVSACLY